MAKHMFMKLSYNQIPLTHFELISKMSTILIPLLAVNRYLILHLGSSQLITAE